jgi:hypothetical protein
MTLKEIEELAGHRQVPAWVVKLVSDAVAVEREAIIGLLKGIDQTECESEDGYWETSFGAAFGKELLSTIRARGQE